MSVLTIPNVWVATAKISERKFAQSVHGANSCNSCHWDITDVKAHAKAKGARIHAEPVDLPSMP